MDITKYVTRDLILKLGNAPFLHGIKKKRKTVSVVYSPKCGWNIVVGEMGVTGIRIGLFLTVQDGTNYVQKQCICMLYIKPPI